jgi:hypothetical protein
MYRAPLIVTLALFGALSAVAVFQHGYWGIFAYQLQTSAGVQVLADLGIALALVLVWIWRDAKSSGRAAWPWIVATLAFGSFGPLAYLLVRATRR